MIVNGERNVDLMSVVVKFIDTDTEGGEGMFRGLVALGTLVLAQFITMIIDLSKR